MSILTAEPEARERQQDGVTVIALQARTPRWSHYRSVLSARRAQEVRAVIERLQPDLIHFHTVAWQCGYAWIAPTARLGTPIVATAHDVMHVACGRVMGNERALWLKDLRRIRWYWNPIRTLLIRRALRHVTLLTVSDALRAYLRTRGLTPACTVHNGIDTTFWHPQDQAEARKTLGIPQDVTVFLLAGRLGEDKGTSLVQAALPPQAHLIIAGDSDRSAFQLPDNRLHWYPRQAPEEMRTLYAACDAVLVPSRCLDCFPTVCLEGMACGRPILATSLGGAREAVEDGMTGWVMDPFHPTLWQNRMQWCIDHRTEVAAYGERARQRATTFFSLPPYQAALDTLYQDARRVC